MPNSALLRHWFICFGLTQKIAWSPNLPGPVSSHQPYIIGQCRCRTPFPSFMFLRQVFRRKLHSLRQLHTRFPFRRPDLTRWPAKLTQLDLTVSFRQHACYEGFGHARGVGPNPARLRRRKAALPQVQHHGGLKRCSRRVSCA